MAKVSKPESDKDVFLVMKKYCQDKGYSFSDTQLRFTANDCFLFWEGRKWDKVKYWPAICMRWVLNNLNKQYQAKDNYKPKIHKIKSVRDIILEQENESV